MRATTTATAVLFTVTIATAQAQTQAAFDPYGESCNGTSESACLTQNDVSPSLSVGSLPNEYAYPVVNTTSNPIQVVGFEVFTVTNTNPVETVNTAVHRDASGAGAVTHTAPDFTAAAVGTITVTNAQAFYATTVYPPLTIAPGEAFWIAHDCFSIVSPAENIGGAAGPATVHWRRPNFNGNAWTTSSSVTNPIFKIRCLASNVPAPGLTASSLPQLGGNFVLDVVGGAPSLFAFVIYSFDNTQVFGLPTPVDLALFNAPGCLGYVSHDVTITLQLDAMGHGSTAPFAVPNNPLFDGLVWYNQAAVIAPGVNPLSLLASNAGQATVGM